MSTETVTIVPYTSTTTINQLNEDSLDHILSYIPIFHLSALSTVCKRWQYLCLQRIGRLKVLDTRKITRDLCGKERRVHISRIAKVLDLNFGNLAHIHIDSKSINHSVKNVTVCVKAPGYIEEVYKCDILFVLSQNCPNLKTLFLHGDSKRVVEFLLPDDFPKKLNSLSVHCGAYLEPEDLLVQLLEHSPNLKMLNIGALKEQNIISEIIRSIEQREITTLSLRQSSDVTPYDLKSLMETTYPSLEDLSITNPFSVGRLCTNAFFTVLPDPEKKCLKLKSFKASQTRFVRASKGSSIPNIHYGIFNIELLSSMPNLEVLDLSWNRHQSDFISVIVENCPLLRRFHISGCEITLKQLLPLQRLMYLEHLDISYSLNTFYRNWSEVVDKVLVKIPNLKYVDLRGTTVNDEAIFSLIANQICLEIVDISDVLTLTGNLLEFIANFVRDKSITIVDRPVYSKESAVQRFLGTQSLPDWFRLNPSNVFSHCVGGFWEKSLKFFS